MARSTSRITPEWEVLTAIASAVETHLRPEVRVKTQPYFLAERAGGEYLGYVGFRLLEEQAVSVKHSPGIPMHALKTTERAPAIVAWIVNQIRKDHPDWFK